MNINVVAMITLFNENALEMIGVCSTSVAFVLTPLNFNEFEFVLEIDGIVSMKCIHYVRDFDLYS